MNKVRVMAAYCAEAARYCAKQAVVWAKAKLTEAWAKTKAVGMSLAVALSLTLPAFASEGGSGSSGSDLSALVSATDTVTTMVSKAWSMILANPLLTFYAAAGLLSVGIGFFAFMKRVAHRN